MSVYEKLEKLFIESREKQLFFRICLSVPMSISFTAGT